MEDCGYSSVPSIINGVDVVAWNEGKIKKLEVRQKTVARTTLNASRYAATEALSVDMRLSTFRERHMKTILRDIESETGLNGGYKAGMKDLSMECKK